MRLKCFAVAQSYLMKDVLKCVSSPTFLLSLAPCDLHCKVIRLPNGQYTSKKRYGQVKIMVFGNALAVLIVSRTNLPILRKGLNSNMTIMINAHQSK